MADEKFFNETTSENSISEMVWLSIKLACVLSAFDRNSPAETQHTESTEAIPST